MADEQARYAQSARAGEAAGVASLRTRGPGHGGRAARRTWRGAGGRRGGGPMAGYEEGQRPGTRRPTRNGREVRRRRKGRDKVGEVGPTTI